MNVRQIEVDELDQARLIWNTCFPEDSSSFLDWFFTKRYKQELSAGCFESGKLVSAAYGTEMPLMIDGNEYPAVMISGVSTMPLYRKHGLMHKCMRLLIEAANDRSAFTFNCPVHLETYANLGYVPCTKAIYILKKQTEFKDNFEKYSIVPFIEKKAFRIYQSAMFKYNGFAYRDINSFHLRIEECLLDGGQGVLFSFDGNVIGYCLFCLEKDKLFIHELVSDASYHSSLCTLARLYSPTIIEAKLPPDSDENGTLKYQNVILAEKTILNKVLCGKKPAYCIDEY